MGPADDGASTPGEAGTSRTATVTTSAPARKIGARANVGEPNVRGHNGDRCGEPYEVRLAKYRECLEKLLDAATEPKHFADSVDAGTELPLHRIA